MEFSDILVPLDGSRKKPDDGLRLLTVYDVRDRTGLRYEAALALVKFHGEKVRGRYYISEAKLRRVLA